MLQKALTAVFFLSWVIPMILFGMIIIPEDLKHPMIQIFYGYFILAGFFGTILFYGLIGKILEDRKEPNITDN